MQRRIFLGLLLAAICNLQFAICNLQSADWYRWRGPEQTGVSRETDLPDRWSPDGENLIWKVPYGGRSTPIIMNGRVYLINSVGDGVTAQERIMCLEADTGKVVWEHKFNVFHTDIDILRVGWTNLAGDPDTGNIYAHGTQGFFMCFDKAGKILWSHSLTEEYGRVSGYGGRNSSPVVDGDLVIIGMINASWGDQAGPGNRWLAVDKKTGTPVWWSASPNRPKDTYSSVPVVAVINGERLLITGGGDGAIHAMKVRTGERVWSYDLSIGGLSSSPVVDGNLVFICHGAENVDPGPQGKVACLDASKVENDKPKLIWQRAGIKVRYTSPLVHDGRLYVCDETARMYCFETTGKGKPLWSYPYGRSATGSPVWADGKIYLGEVTSKFHILQPTDKGCKTLHSQVFPSPEDGTDVEISGNPAVANGRLYFSTSFETYCIGKKEHKATAQVPALAAEPPADPKAKPAHLQVVPAEGALYPGESATFKARAFDAHGRFLREVEAKWSLPAPPPPPKSDAKPPPLQGQIDADGKLTVKAAPPPGQFGLVQAAAEGLTARARVRVVPPSPYRADFSQIPVGRTPGGWVNTQGKFVIVEKDGKHVLKKLANNASPLFARANAYMGMPNLTDYTIQADLQSAKKGDDVSDMGVVANRYILLLNNKQQLRIISWESTPQARVDKTIAFKWEPDHWYRMKLTVKVNGNKAVIRGKVWPRDQEEPKKWTIEFEDSTPNGEGSPALYGYVNGITEEPGAEIFYDNVSVTPNKKQ